MLRHSILIGAAVLAGTVIATASERPPRQLDTLADIGKALRACWRWPPAGEVRSGMELTVLLSFKRNGEIFGARIVYQSRDVSERERALYHGALLDTLRRCNPLPVSDSLGHAIAGRPMRFRFHDTRQQRKAEIHG
ncbi:MAG: hypothetical protein FJX62_14720 [Alphaproteobacteria bacterium]|nr:hypothetical protein [Alphaproteobacteria bacterium]